MRVAPASARKSARFVQSSLEHLLPTPFSRKDRRVMPNILSGGAGPAERRRHVPPRQRVPLWNLAIDDVVRVISGPPDIKHRLGRIRDVDRKRNAVWLKDAPFQRKRPRDVNEPYQTVTIPPIQYSNLQLVLGNYDIEPSAVEQPSPTATTAIVKPGRAWLGRRIADDAEVTPLSRTIVATRLRATNLRWVGRTRSFVWDRVPLALRALRPDGKSYEPWQIDMRPPKPLEPSQLVGDAPARAANHIPWPVQTQVREEGTLLAGPYEALPSAALRMTWRPTDLYAITAEGAEATETSEAQPEVLMWESRSDLLAHSPELNLSQFEFGNPDAARKRAHRARLADTLAVRRRTRRTSEGRLLDDLRRSTRRGWLRAWRGRAAASAMRS